MKGNDGDTLRTDLWTRGWGVEEREDGIHGESNRETNIEKRLTDMGRGKGRRRRMERVTWKLTLPYVK